MESIAASILHLKPWFVYKGHTHVSDLVGQHMSGRNWVLVLLKSWSCSEFVVDTSDMGMTAQMGPDRDSRLEGRVNLKTDLTCEKCLLDVELWYSIHRFAGQGNYEDSGVAWKHWSAEPSY